MAGNRPALSIQSRRTGEIAFLAGATVHELSDFLPRDGKAWPITHRPHSSRRAGCSTNFGLSLAHVETLRAIKPKAQVIVPEYKQVVEV